MSNYCKNCRYKVSEKSGEDACPFNYLYWDFLDRHREKLGNNPRLGMIYRTFDKMAPEKQAGVSADASRFLAGFDKVGYGWQRTLLAPQTEFISKICVSLLG